MKIIRIHSDAAGYPCEVAGQYVESFSHDVNGWRGVGTFTADRRKAMQFITFDEAWEFWGRRSRGYPTRPDGKPNRPLTAYSVVIEDI